MKKIIPVFTAVIAILTQSASYGQDIPLNKFDKRGVKVVNNFMKALMDNQDDEQAAAKAALPFIHPSEYDNGGTNLKRDRLDFSFKKAWQNAGNYQVPVKVTRVQQQNISAIGFGKTAQSGTVFKVWIAKKEGAGGVPAPLSVFFPDDGSAPTLNGYGSL